MTHKIIRVKDQGDYLIDEVDPKTYLDVRQAISKENITFYEYRSNGFIHLVYKVRSEIPLEVGKILT